MMEELNMPNTIRLLYTKLTGGTNPHKKLECVENVLIIEFFFSPQGSIIHQVFACWVWMHGICEYNDFPYSLYVRQSSVMCLACMLLPLPQCFIISLHWLTPLVGINHSWLMFLNLFSRHVGTVLFYTPLSLYWAPQWPSTTYSLMLPHV